ncbi:MAG TPA: hypothetical protein VKD66_00990 [Streptosporangiaceae bacterium]|nr:hypothetical protein [Streptosporangiaceae bacterium]
MRRRRTKGARLRGLVRMWRPDGNPLRRTADRVEAVAVVVLIATFLCGAPLAALTAGRAAAASGFRAEHAQAGWHRVTAVLLGNAPASVHPMFQAELRPRAPARWTAPDGTPRTGRVYAPVGAAVGSTVAVWINGSGRPAPPLLRRSDVVEGIVLAASLAAGAVAAVLAALGFIVRWALDRRRLAAWDARWAVTGPQWTDRH